MAPDLIQIIVSDDEKVRNRSLESALENAGARALLAQCRALEEFRQRSSNLYHRVRALFFLYAIHRFHLPGKRGVASSGRIPYEGHEHLLERRFEEAIRIFLAVQQEGRPSESLSSALAAAYYQAAFQTLANQVRHSVRALPGNQWMFRMGHPKDHPLRVRPELLERRNPSEPYPLLCEETPVRMDLSHNGWSDIFFLGMDYPEGARVMNVSIDLAVRGRDKKPGPPVEAYFRVIEEPVIRLVSVDLEAHATITSLDEIFDFAKDYLGLLKAALIASGIVPPGLEGSGQRLEALLEELVGKGRGLELVSKVNNIPKGSRLAVSTNLLCALIAVCMRATRQAGSLTGELAEEDRRLAAARAILGEWLGGSGGGWQDSGGVWPGIKLIEGVAAAEGDPEFGVSRGRLLPRHHVFSFKEISKQTRRALQDSLVLVHGGMAQNVGPILEMVTEKYLLRSEAEWKARLSANEILNGIVRSLRQGRMKAVGQATQKNFFEPLQTIIPWATNDYTERLIESVSKQFKSRFHGFWMLGGMAGGGMGFIFDPKVQAEGKDFLESAMAKLKTELQSSVPFAMDPVVYDFSINHRGSAARLKHGREALMPPAYYGMMSPQWLRSEFRGLSAERRTELDYFAEACRTDRELSGMVRTLFDRMMPKSDVKEDHDQALGALLNENGFDAVQHEQIRAAMQSGRIGLAQNRLPLRTRIEDVREGDVVDCRPSRIRKHEAAGRRSIRNGETAIITLAAGAGSRWTQGAGVVKAVNPFCKFQGRHRSFLEIHLAAARKTCRALEADVPHIITTSYLTHQAIENWLQAGRSREALGSVLLSPGRSIGLRMTPMERDLRFMWEEMPRQQLDERKQKVQESLHAALIQWAKETGEGSDYTDNLPQQCLHPVGHWYEFANLLRNGVLRGLLASNPGIRYLMLRNVDTLGAQLDPAMLGVHIDQKAGLSFEVIHRRLEDRGGGLARVDGQARLVEGLALPGPEEEFKLTFYNSNTTWITLDLLLAVFGLTRSDLNDDAKVLEAIRTLSARIPAYLTLKEVKKRWGHGQEDVFPVAQFEKIWADFTSLHELKCAYLAAPRMRGQQLKDPAQLDGWMRDGSWKYVNGLCDWNLS